MFLKKTLERNRPLIETAVNLHKGGLLFPDTYIVDMDALLTNASVMKGHAEQNGIHLYFMLKQLGRNPEIARELIQIGYDGAVAVDFREAESLIDAGIPLGNVGHLVQTPRAALRKILKSGPEYVTVYSLEKVSEINDVCEKLGVTQRLMLRVLGESDILYSGQYGGFSLNTLAETAKEISKFDHVRIAGLTSFPCFLFQEKTGTVEPTPNVGTLQSAKKLLTDLGLEIEEMNMPSATCSESIPLIRKFGGTHGEPGHGLTGTTPLHEVVDCEEIPALIYLSEISHECDGKAYCYGGGHYRRSHVKQALIGAPEEGKFLDVIPPTDESIDYYFGLNGSARVSESVIMAFRTQIFVTRSQVALVKGIAKGEPEIMGIYTSLGQRLK